MKGHRLEFHLLEMIGGGLLTLALLALVLYLHSARPDIYARLIAEDQWGEYATAVSLTIAGLTMILLAFGRTPWPGRIAFGTVGVSALFIAGEEVSWGQRFLHFRTPDLLGQANYQGELTLHNIETVALLRLDVVVACAILFWSIFSIVVRLRPTPLGRKVQETGIPLIPLPLILLFLSIPFFFLTGPVVKWDETGELFLGLAMLAWAVDLLFQRRFNGRCPRLRVPTTMGVFALVALGAALLTHFFPGNLTWWFNTLASRDYPSSGRYRQAGFLYEYILAHPHHLTPETRLNYGKLLMAAGREADALRILSKAREELEALDLKRAQQSRNLRKMGTILILLGEKEKADLAFDQALERDLRRLRGAAGPDEKARTLWSVARTLDARGDREGALKKAEEAQIAAGSADLRWWIGRWAKGVAGGAENP